MVTQGWAVDYRRYSMDHLDEEDAAQEAQKGLWGGEFEPPCEWRGK